MAFVLPLALSPSAGHPSTSKRRRKHAFFALSQADWLHTSDTLRGFEALCERAQNTFCTAAAAMDGLGTFENLPDSYRMHADYPGGFLQNARNSQPEKCRSMKGGRNFEQAVVSVWRAPSPSHMRPSSRSSRSSRSSGGTDGVGLSLRLQPRDTRLPILRANVPYFQLSGRCTTWWFSGAADLSLGKQASPNAFANDSRVFLNKVRRQPLERHRRERNLTDAAFLDACLFSEEKSDKLAAFAFAGDVVELLLPAYLPLVAQQKTTNKYGHKDHDSGPFETDTNIRTRGEAFERFGLDGGASCESQVTQMAPFAWWSFTVAPRNSSPEGRRFKAMRKGVQPPPYM